MVEALGVGHTRGAAGGGLNAVGGWLVVLAFQIGTHGSHQTLAPHVQCLRCGVAALQKVDKLGGLFRCQLANVLNVVVVVDSIVQTVVVPAKPRGNGVNAAYLSSGNLCCHNCYFLIVNY